MLQKALDKRWVRVTLAVLVGLPGTLLAVISFLLGVSGLPGTPAATVRGVPLYAPFALLLMLGLVGIWWRIYKPSSTITDRERTRIRALLFGGTIASAGFDVIAVLYGDNALVPFFTVLAGITLLFIFATPNSK